MNNELKKLLGFIDSVCYITTGNTILNHFITKYHDSHNLNNYRLLKNSDVSEAISYDIIKNIITDIGIDLLVVASHYSEQYTNADNYLHISCDNSQVKDYSLYLVNNNRGFFAKRPAQTSVVRSLKNCFCLCDCRSFFAHILRY